MSSIDLISQISADLNIVKGNNERREQYICRVLYSATGSMAFSFLSNPQNQLSVVQFKDKLTKLLEAYFKIIPEVFQYNLWTIEEMVDMIYNLLLKTGYCYHSDRWITRAIPKSEIYSNIEFVRSPSVSDNVKMSGIGPYRLIDSIFKNDMASIAGMFGIEKTSLSEKYGLINENIVWEERDIPAETEYLRTSPSYSRGYWKKTADREANISLYRFEESGNIIYRFYKTEGDTLLSSQTIPDWQVKDGQYRNIACSILYSNGTLPSIKYRNEGALVYVRLQYLLPPAELNLFYLYSWPASFRKYPSGFDRLVNRNVFYAFKKFFEEKGYTVELEDY